MTGKIFKYENQAIGRVLLPIYAAMAGVTILLALTGRFIISNPAAIDQEGGPVGALAITLGMLYAGLIVAAAVMTFVMIALRFYKNFLGNQGYLMFALPVSTAEHIAGRALSGLLWTILSGLSALLSMVLGTVLMAALIPDYSLAGLLADLKDLYEGITFVPSTILIGLVMGITSILATIMKIYAAIAIGHQVTNHRLIGAVGAYIGLGFAETLLTILLTSFGLAAGGTGFWTFFNMETLMGTEFSSVMIGAIASLQNLLEAGVLFALAWILLDRRLNLE